MSSPDGDQPPEGIVRDAGHAQAAEQHQDEEPEQHHRADEPEFFRADAEDVVRRLRAEVVELRRVPCVNPFPSRPPDRC